MWKQPGMFPRLKQDRSKLAGLQSLHVKTPALLRDAGVFF